ncbi:MAG: HupE/UreJ family protein [Myxococcota bacterium]|jgi:hypothetical protein|nr:HupE/UreJ family protein [Myxococcota bacterium]
MALVALAFVLATPAFGHTKSISYSSWELGENGARVRVRVSLLELSRLGFAPNGRADEEQIAPYLEQRLRLSADGVPCTAVATPRALKAPEGSSWWQWDVACSSSNARVIESHLLLDVAPSHIHFARAHDEGVPTRERVLSDAEPSWSIDARASGGGDAGEGTSVAGYLVLGVEHILTGWDHLAFVLALLLLAGSLGEVAKLVTGFTVAHSVTLALAVLGVLDPDPAPIEALIGFSIALVAAENAWLLAGRGPWIPSLLVLGVVAMTALAAFGVGMTSPVTLAGVALFSACHFGLLARVRRPEGLRVAVAFAFGLIHGFGFAGILAELSLPQDRLLAALFGFNVGVEVGQLGVVVLVWPLLRLIQRAARDTVFAWVAEGASAAICALGVFWFVSRSFG